MKQETAKEILDRCAPKWIGEDCVPRDQVLAALKEIAERAHNQGWEGHKRLKDRDESLEVVMKELFPEDKTGHSES